LDVLKQQMNGSDNSPVMARAPLLLSESLLFPYREGLSFEQDLWMDQGQAAAFANVLDKPPTSSWEIINPREYEKHHTPAVPLLPDIHPLVDKLYKPYDIGQVGQLDVHILTALFGGDSAARNLTPAWNGGLYWAGQLRTAKTSAELGSTKSLALLYLAAWRNAASAQNFAKLYADSLGRKYSGLKVDDTARSSAPDDGKSPQGIFLEQVFTTAEGPVVITTRGKLVFIAESFPLDIARKLTDLVLEAQGTGEMKMAMSPPPPGIDIPSGIKQCAPSMRPLFVAWVGNDKLNSVPTGSSNLDQTPEPRQPLTAGLIRIFSNAGVMKAVVDAELRTAQTR
jgi:hypothetical protein